jgi:Hemerythrin HHE cation binding domain
MLLLDSSLRIFLIPALVRPVSLLRIPLFLRKPHPPTSTAVSFSTASPISAMVHRFSSDPWNELHDGMQLYHNHFRQTFNHIYTRCDAVTSGAEDADELSDLLASAYGLYRHLDAHHSIEEYSPNTTGLMTRTYIFPILAERMPQFKQDGDHLKEHEGIHKGLDEYVAYIKKCRKDSKDWDGEKMKNIMDSFRDILFKHLDHEVESLSGENLKKVKLLD